MTTKISALPANQQIGWAAGAAATVSTPLLNLTQTWSGTATFTLDFANVTADPGPSNAASLLIDRQYLGASKFSVNRSGDGVLASSLQVGSNGSSTSSSLGFYSGGLVMGSGARIGWTSGAVSTTQDLTLFRDAANTLALRNGVSAQTLRAFNTFTDASNGEWGTFDWTHNPGTLYVGENHNGTGSTARSVQLGTIGTGYVGLQTSDTLRWYVNGTAGHFLANADNTYDIGANGANRPRNIFGAGYVQTGAVAVASLPAASTALKGARHFVTDANAATFGTTAAGGGANNVPVVCNGTVWVIG